MNPQSARALAKLDPRLKKLIAKIGPIELIPDPKQTLFAALTRSIIYQQLHGKAAASIHKKLLAGFPKKRHPSPADFIAATPEELRVFGVSRGKALALKDLALKTEEGVVPTAREVLRLSDEELIERLTRIRGVGPWTVEMLLIFKLGRPDVLPVTDFGVRNGFARHFGLKEMPTPKALRESGLIWAPHRSTAALYLWRAADLPKQEK
jgi:DNA-3-methyladenine glycosylase II